MRLAKLVPILPLCLAFAFAPSAAPAELSPHDLTEAAARTVAGLLAGELPPARACTSCADGCSDKCLTQTAAYRAEMARNLPAFYAREVAASAELNAGIRPVVLARFEDARLEQRRVLLDFVCHLPVGEAAAFEDELYRIDPKSFSLDHVLTFAGRGAMRCASTLETFAEQSNGQVDADVRPAVFMALAGRDLGRPALERTVARVDLPRGAAPALLAGMGLEALGQKGRLEEAWGLVTEAALAALDEGDLSRARRLTAEAEFFADFLGKYAGKHAAASTKTAKTPYRKAPLALFGGDLEAYCVDRSEELSGAADVFHAIESVTPL